MTEERLLRADQIARRLDVPTSWVREHTRAGAIPHIKLGRWIRYSAADVDGWLEQCKAGGGPTFRKHQPRRRENAAEEEAA